MWFISTKSVNIPTIYSNFSLQHIAVDCHQNGFDQTGIILLQAGFVKPIFH